MMQEMWHKIMDCWQLKAFWAGCVSCLTFLLGDVTATPFIALGCLVALDTITRWMAISHNEAVAEGRNGSLLDGFGVAVIFSRINSETFRVKFFNKMLSYLVLLIGFNLLDWVIPDVIFGQQFVGFPNSFISTWLAIGEIKSILENLIEAGASGLRPLVIWAQKKQNQMTDGTTHGVSTRVLSNQESGTPLSADEQQRLLQKLKEGRNQ